MQTGQPVLCGICGQALELTAKEKEFKVPYNLSWVHKACSALDIAHFLDTYTVERYTKTRGFREMGNYSPKIHGVKQPDGSSLFKQWKESKEISDLY